MKILRIIFSKIIYKLLAGFAFVSLFVGIISFISLRTIKNIRDGYEQVSTKSLPIVLQLEEMRFNCLRLISSASEFAYIQAESKNLSEELALEQENELMQQACNSCHSAFSKYEQLVKESFPDAVEDIDQIRSKRDLLHTSVADFTETKKKGISGIEALEKKEEMEKGEMAFLDAIKNALSHTHKSLEEEKTYLDTIISSSYKNILFLSVLTFLLSMLFGILISRSISKPILKLTHITSNLWKGNMDARVEIKSFDEIGMLGKSIYEMDERIKQLISQLENEIVLTEQAKELLKQSGHQMELILEVAGEGIIGLDLNGNHTFINPKACDILGYKVEELIGKNCHNVFHHSYPDGAAYPYIKCPIHETLKDGKVHFGEEYFWKKNGSCIPVSFSSLPVKENEIITGAVVTFKDITESKRVEKEIRETNEELSKINAEKDKFFSIISHDLKSPFNSVIGFTNLLIEKISKKDLSGIEKYTNIIQQSSNRAMDLLMNLMEWTQSQTGRMEFNPEYFELVELIKDTELLLSGAAVQKSIIISKTLPPNVTVFADKKMIGTVLRNFLSNAIKFTNPNGQIIISAVKNQTGLKVSVSDNGVGISKANIQKMFRIDENFTTLGTNREKGTGLGLILCKEFIEKHGGKIWVESIEGTGSSFYFTLSDNAETKEKNDIDKIIPDEEADNPINQ